MASTQLQELAEQFRANPFDIDASVEAWRAAFEGFALPLPEATAVTATDAAGVPAEWVVATGADPGSRILYLHAGGYVYGSLNTHRHFAAGLSQAARCAVLLLDYRLAPEAPFPAAVEDTCAAYRWMRDNGPGGPGAAATIFIAGDSAGGGLALAALVALRDAGDLLPDAAVTLSAWTDLTCSGESMTTRADADPMTTDVNFVRKLAAMYLHGADAKTPLASPLYADPSGLPPLFMLVGDAEVLLSDTTSFAEKARAAGVDVTAEVWPEMFHIWPLYFPILPEGREGLERIGAFLRKRVPAAG